MKQNIEYTKTSIIGYPRIGSNRELKVSLEKYFSKEITLEELNNTALELKKSNWIQEKNEGLTFITSGDFSFYDIVLDTCFLLGAIPERYKDLSLSKIDTYFAMARGYQDEGKDVKALPMKKWFNTNYHYIVPELEDNTVLNLDSSKLVNEYKEAKDIGIGTKVNLIGPYTFLKLCHYTGTKKISDFAKVVSSLYNKLLQELKDAGVKWVQIEEPCLVLDTTEEDKNLFRSIYEIVLENKKINIILATYFGDVRDTYKELTELNVDAIALDFVEGKNLQCLKEYGFPKDKKLFCGVINGKNIWKNNYEKTLNILEEISKYTEAELVLNTSCSLLHVPYTIRKEKKLSVDILKYFSFAFEKLRELKDIADIIDQKEDYLFAYRKNKELFSLKRIQENNELKAKIQALCEDDFVRKPCIEERRLIQVKSLNLPLYPTTTIGSFPQTKEVRLNRSNYKKNLISKEEYVEFNKNKIKECIKEQEELGLDVLVHGEFERNDMVEYFGENLDGYIFTEKAWVQSYGTRCVKPPIIWSDVTRISPITVKWAQYAQSLTEKPVKGMLTGPVTILNWSFPREDISLKEEAYQIAFAIRDEVLDLEANGIKIIQIDEAALKEKLPLRKEDWHKEYLDWAIKAFNLVHSGVKPETQIHTHMCYSEFIPIIKDIDNMDADVITFEASRSNLEILEALKKNDFKTQVGPGVYDIHSPRVPSEEEIIEAVDKMKNYVSKEKLWINPDCGLKTRGIKETHLSLTNLVKAAKVVRQA